MMRLLRAFLFISIVVIALSCAQIVAEPVVIMPLGDSLTWGLPSSGDKTPGGYRTELSKLLTDAGRTVQFIGTQTDNPSQLLKKARQTHHEGHNGYTINEIFVNLDGDDGRPDSNGGHWLTGTGSRAAAPPDIILLHIGTNDITLRNYARASELANRLEMLVEKIFALRPDVHLFVSNLIPYNDPASFDAQKIYNRKIEVVIVPKFAGQGRKITFVDQRSNFLDKNGIVIVARLPDSVHPDQTGYDLMGRTWAKVILSHLENSSSRDKD
jgi:hypothetical protein